MNIGSIYEFIMKPFRPARAIEIKKRFPILSDTNALVLDVGREVFRGSVFPWSEIKPAARIIILNRFRPNIVPENCRWEFVEGDGTNLQYADGSFDLVFSNSVIEHVGEFDTQRRFANEMLRVGKRIYCQTPNKWFLLSHIW